jgi:hypothetical protein
VPVSVTSQLKVVMVPVFDAAVRVSVAWIEAPAARTVLCRFHVNVSEEPAPLGVQLLVVMVNVSAMLPVFLTYTVCVVVPPGLRVPTARDVTVCVQALSEYTPKFTAFIVPLNGTVWLLLRIAAVVSVSASAVIVSAIIAILGIFVSFILLFPNFISRVVSINKH